MSNYLKHNAESRKLARGNAPPRPREIEELLLKKMAFKLTPEEKIQAALHRKKNKAKNWQYFCKKNRRVYGTLPIKEYERIAQIAARNGRNVWQQVIQQSNAYEKARFLPSERLETHIESLYVALRRIGNNINQIAHHTNFLNRFNQQSELAEQVKELETMIFEFIKKPWTAPKLPPKPAPTNNPD